MNNDRDSERRLHRLLDRSVRAASHLVSRCSNPPPRRRAQQDSMMHLAELLATEAATEAAAEASHESISAFRQQFLDALVTRVEQQLQWCACRRCGEMFVCCEYNRDGDAYRCPRCSGWSCAPAVPQSETDDSKKEASSQSALHRAVVGGAAPKTLSHTTATAAELLFLVRCVERLGSEMFSQFGRAYFKNTQPISTLHEATVASCFAWADNVGPTDAESTSKWYLLPSSLSVTVHLVHAFERVDEQEGENDTWLHTMATCPCGWASSHVVHVALPLPHADTATAAASAVYQAQSTIMLNVTNSSRDEDADALFKDRTHGFVATETQTWSSRRPVFTAPVGDRTIILGKWDGITAPGGVLTQDRDAVAAVARVLLQDIGEHVQTLENHLRDAVEVLYCGPVRQRIADGLRVAGGVTEESHRMMNVRHDSCDTDANLPIGTTLPAVTDSNNQQSTSAEDVAATEDTSEDPWQSCLDDEGNVYYYHTVTGETSWERPDPSDMNHREKEQQSLPAATAAAEAGVGDAEHLVTPLSVLESLGLQEPAFQYYKTFKSYFKQFYGERFTIDLLHDMDNAAYTVDVPTEDPSNADATETKSILDAFVPVFGDRRKIRKYLQRQRASEE